MLLRLFLFRAAPLIAHQMTWHKVVNVVGEWIIPLKLVDGDDVIHRWRQGIGPAQCDVDELAALVAYLISFEYSLFCLLEANSSAPQRSWAVL